MSDGAGHFIPRSDAQLGVWAAQFRQTADAGKPARSMMRWVGHGNTRGPWSNVASATVAA